MPNPCLEIFWCNIWQCIGRKLNGLGLNVPKNAWETIMSKDFLWSMKTSVSDPTMLNSLADPWLESNFRTAGSLSSFYNKLVSIFRNFCNIKSNHLILGWFCQKLDDAVVLKRKKKRFKTNPKPLEWIFNQIFQDNQEKNKSFLVFG